MDAWAHSSKMKHWSYQHIDTSTYIHQVFRVDDVDTDFTGTKQNTIWCPCQGDIPKLLGFPWVAVTIKGAGLDTICEYSRFLGPLMVRLWEPTLLQRLPNEWKILHKPISVLDAYLDSLRVQF